MSDGYCTSHDIYCCGDCFPYQYGARMRFTIGRYGSNVHAGQGKRRHVMRPAMWEHVMQRTKAEDEKRKDKTHGRRTRIETESQFRERLGRIGDVATYDGGVKEDDTRVK